MSFRAARTARITLTLLLLQCRGQDWIGCQLGDRVVAFFSEHGCEPEEARCWRNGTIADGPGRGDAFITVLWDVEGKRFQRMHASYAKRVRDGIRCLPPYGASTSTRCTNKDCDHFEDRVQDAVGEVLRDVSGRKLSCDSLNSMTQQGCQPSVRQHCPDTCDRLERALRIGSRRCFSPRKTLPLLQRYAHWRWYSQASQDSVMHLLLVRPEGAVPLAAGSNGGEKKPPFFVEFGYSWHLLSNSEYLRRIGWQGVRFDLDYSQPSALLHRAEITAATVVDVFKEHGVPDDVDLVSIDIDSCDIWIFLALTAPDSPYRPRLIQIEYNRHFSFDDQVALDCSSGEPPWGAFGTWPIKEFPVVGSNIYGASLKAIERAAESRGYTVVWVEKCYDVFLVRNDLICPDSGLIGGLENFREFVAKEGEHHRCRDGIEWFAKDVGTSYKNLWVKDFPPSPLKSEL